jgi:phosphohistidine phosphatase SixA
MKSLVLVLLAGASGVAFAQAKPPVDPARLLAELRQGGFILYFRHTATLPEHEHEARHRRAGTHSIEDCSTQRNLSERGYLEARAQADWVKRLGIPMGDVLASRYCRTRIHAGFFTPSFAFDDAITPVRNAEKAAVVKRMLNTPPRAGTNTFVFAHGGILWMATDYDSVESELFIFKPGGAAVATYVASVRIDELEAFAAGKPCCAPRNFWSGKGTPPVE